MHAFHCLHKFDELNVIIFFKKSILNYVKIKIDQSVVPNMGDRRKKKLKKSMKKKEGKTNTGVHVE